MPSFKVRILNDEHSPVEPPLIWWNLDLPNLAAAIARCEYLYHYAWTIEMRHA